ncbi:MAG TPA: pyridoxamine 5'-phosphate oxidase family protein [Euzebya sp.]|nr:pyridoxamine 5'-phosphate oxidase family protein [Euzebya sp.]
MPALRRSRLEELDLAACWVLLRQHEYGVGRVAVGGSVPIILPVNYLVDGGDLILRTGSGSVRRAAEDGAWLAFEVDSLHGPEVGEDEEVWSVVAKGPSRVVGEHDRRTFLDLAHLEPQAGGFRPHYIAITVEELTGRRRR